MNAERKSPVPCWLPQSDVQALDALVYDHRYMNRSDAIRAAVRLLLEKHRTEAKP